MGFFSEFDAWLTRILGSYIDDNTASVALALEPAVLTFSAIYVMIWGYLHITGQAGEPFTTGLKRIILLATILGVGLHLWLYNAVIVDTFFNAPGQLAANVVGAYDPVSVVDEIIFKGGDVADKLRMKGGLLSGNLDYGIAGMVVYAITGIMAVYTMFLLAMSRVALSVLLALGPLFITFLLFDATRRFFQSWIGQMANYAFISVLTVLLAILMLHIVAEAADRAIERGDGIEIADAARVCIAAGLSFLVMRQVLPLAAALGGGVALNSFGTLSGVLRESASGGGKVAKGAGLLIIGAHGKAWSSGTPSVSGRPESRLNHAVGRAVALIKRRVQ